MFYFIFVLCPLEIPLIAAGTCMMADHGLSATSGRKARKAAQQKRGLAVFDLFLQSSHEEMEMTLPAKQVKES